MQLEEDNERSKHAIQPPEPTDLRNSTGFAPTSFSNNNVNVNPKHTVKQLQVQLLLMVFPRPQIYTDSY